MDTALERSHCGSGEKENRACVKTAFFIGNMSHSGGTERVLAVIANGLAEKGFEIFILSLWGNGESFFSVDKKIKIYWLEQECKGAGLGGRLRRLNSILKTEQAEALVDVDIILGCYSFFLKKKIPKLYWISWEHFNYYHHFKRNHLLRQIVKRVVGRCSNQLVVLTDKDLEAYRKHVKLRCGITCIHNPVPYEKTFFKQEEERMILAAGRLTREKGFDLLIQSWRYLEADYPEWRLVIAGEGEDRKKLEKILKAAGLKQVQLIGNVSNIEEYYRKARFFVLSSRSEGFGMVLLEAMCFSNPIVSYACKAGPGEIVQDGENGFLIEPGDVKGFAGKMEIFMKDEELCRKMGEAARESVNRFGKEKVLRQWEMLLKKSERI